MENEMKINFSGNAREIICRVTNNGLGSEKVMSVLSGLDDSVYERLNYLVNDAMDELERHEIKVRLDRFREDSLSLSNFYDEELLKNARVRYEKFKPFSEGVYPSACSHCKKNIAIRIKDVIFNDPATIVFWSDGTKTVVKAENEPFDREKGLAMAIAKKFLGNKGNYFETFKKFIKEDTK